MLLLLPPSETKLPGGENTPQTLSWHKELKHTRQTVLEALENLCQNEEEALQALKLGARGKPHIKQNQHLRAAPLMPAIERYTGVLYDALNPATLPRAAREHLNENVAIQSALYGLIRANDTIPAYRLSATSRLPKLNANLNKTWQAAHSKINWHREGLILDIRSEDYRKLAPLPENVGYQLLVARETRDGKTKALGHFNKHAKGLFVRRIAASGAIFESSAALSAWAQAEGLRLNVTGENEITLLVGTESETQ